MITPTNDIEQSQAKLSRSSNKLSECRVKQVRNGSKSLWVKQEFSTDSFHELDFLKEKFALKDDPDSYAPKTRGILPRGKLTF